jgi:AraC-like DNA-binding protein
LATRYVTNSKLPLARVAGLVGYSRQSSFSRWFAEEFGSSPTAWRAQIGKAPAPADQ